MAQRLKQRVRRTVETLEACWACLCFFLNRLSTPFDVNLGLCNDSWSDNTTRFDNASREDKDAKVSLCSRECPGCRKPRRLDYFYGVYDGNEYLYCVDCRHAGKGETLYTAWGSPTHVTRQYSSSPSTPPVRDESRAWEPFSYVAPKPKKPDYFEIQVTDDTRALPNPLVAGEIWTTWDSIFDESPKAIKQRRRNRQRSRRYSNLPWIIETKPVTDYEKNVRERCERLWRHGMDEHLPDGLLSFAYWSDFWQRYHSRHVQKATIVG